MSHRLLIAGVGNIFLGDKGFGVEVVKRLASETLPDGVLVADFGMRGIRLAYELLNKDYDTMILVNAESRGGEPGTVYCLDPDLETVELIESGSSDANGRNPEGLVGLFTFLWGTQRRLFVIGCEPARTEENIGLSEPVAHAVEDAVQVILHFVRAKSSVMSLAE